MTPSVYELLDNIEQRPGMYLHPVTLPSLKNLLSGYFVGLRRVRGATRTRRRPLTIQQR